MTLIRVDFPAPFSPSNACTSPWCRSKETFLRARTAAKDLVMESSWSNGALIGARWGETPSSEALALAGSEAPDCFRDHAETVQPAKAGVIESGGQEVWDRG